MRSLNISLEQMDVFSRIQKRSYITHKWVVCRIKRRL